MGLVYHNATIYVETTGILGAKMRNMRFDRHHRI